MMSWKEDIEKGIIEAFEKVKQDVFALVNELSEVREELANIKLAINYLDSILVELREFRASTHKFKTSTHPVTSTHTSTDNYSIQALKYPNIDISTGNRGASTDRQTDNQTDNSTHFTRKSVDQTLNEASEMLENLDALKKELRLKFKQMTDQEMLVFSTIYQLEEQGHLNINYKQLALKLGLSQSSIRDYIQRMITKGIPVLKTKVNNKKIVLKISPELKKIATLQTIIQLREI